MSARLLVLPPRTGDSMADGSAEASAVLRLGEAGFDVVALEDLWADVLAAGDTRPAAAVVAELADRAREMDGLVVMAGAEGDVRAAALLAALEGSGLQRRTVPGWLTWRGQQEYMGRLRHPAGKGRVNA